MRKRQRFRPVILLLAATASCIEVSVVYAAPDGADLYDQECGDCHSLARPARNKKGPSLIGIMGKPAAGVPNFAYSTALQASKLLWTTETLDAYIKNPKAVVTGGGKMKYDGLANAAERAAIIEFINTQK